MEKKYDLRKLIQRTYDNIPCDSEQEKAAVTVRIFDVEKEVDLSELGAYRKADIVSLIESAFENRNNRMLAKIPDNLESIAAQNPTEPSMGKTVYEIAKDYAKNILKLPRYALFGAMPAKVQEKLGKKYCENPLNYTTANIIAESVGNAGLIAYLGSTINFSQPITGVFAIFCFYSGFSTLFRSFIRVDNKNANGNWLIRGLYGSIGYTLSAFKNKYITKRRELTAKLGQKKSPQIETTKQKKTKAFPYNHVKALGFDEIKPYITPKIETTGTKQLPSPESSALQKVK